MSIDSDHINLLVYRYLLESGFQHSSFTFAHESGISRSSVADTKLPPGALIAHLQRALNYVQAEVNLTEDGRPADVDDLDDIEALTLLESAQPEVCEQRRRQLWEKSGSSSNGVAEPKGSGTQSIESIEISTSSQSKAGPLILTGHEATVYNCCWSPVEDFVVSASGDSTARVWSIEPGAEPIVLRHFLADSSSKDVTCAQWSPDGSMIATGSTDGAARVWTKTGDLKMRLIGHQGAIFTVEWNSSGSSLLTCSVDGTVCAWNSGRGEKIQQFSVHAGPCIDVTWKSETEFASCSTDKTIVVCEIGKNEPIISFSEHEMDITVIEWNDIGSHLASGSDDSTVKVWTCDQPTALHTFQHKDKVMSLSWSKSKNSQATLMLASASFDCTVKIWDVKRGSCLFTLQGHKMPVYGVDFSPDNSMIASGSFDYHVHIWSVETGNLIKSYHAESGVMGLHWNRNGSKLAACFSDFTLAIMSPTDGDS